MLLNLSANLQFLMLGLQESSISGKLDQEKWI